MKKNHLFSISNLSFFYRLGKEKVFALKNVSVDLPKESLITLSGPSGSGKSTLLHILGLIEPLQEGFVTFFGEDISHWKNREQNLIRKEKIGFVFQRFHLIPVLNVQENIAYFLLRMGLSKKESLERTKEALLLVGLYDHRYKRPLELSGGQRQRVAIARALVKKPSVILADEPTANLDQKTGREIMDILRKMVDDKKVSIVISTHDPMVLSYADTKIHLSDGKIMKEGA